MKSGNWNDNWKKNFIHVFSVTYVLFYDETRKKYTLLWKIWLFSQKNQFSCESEAMLWGNFNEKLEKEEYKPSFCWICCNDKIKNTVSTSFVINIKNEKSGNELNLKDLWYILVL